ncbi:hypothetical protein [Polaribacter sp.]|uniref:hypothetical protein n=1 Tax=Polaribacter sp. TaxID=1920175 RepID=UPI003EF47979
MEIDYNKVIINLFVAKLEKDFGSKGIDRALFLATKIKSVYEVIDVRKFKNIKIITSLEKHIKINDKLVGNIEELNSSLELVTDSSSPSIFLEFTESGKIFFSEDVIDTNSIKNVAIIYEKIDEFEYFHNKTDKDLLEPLNGIDSYFAPNTFKSLDESLEFYKTNVAKNTSCKILQGIWHDDYKIKIAKGASEGIMRDSLCQFLKYRLRGLKEVMPEQNVNEKNPVDIKVFWNSTKHIAFIEIKWLGKSISNTSYSQSRALDGAKQLVDYLDEYAQQNPNMISNGYLVVFDARRKKIDNPISELTTEDVDFYKDKKIEYNPKYEEQRDDYAKPQRFFLNANLSN